MQTHVEKTTRPVMTQRGSQMKMKVRVKLMKVKKRSRVAQKKTSHTMRALVRIKKDKRKMKSLHRPSSSLAN